MDRYPWFCWCWLWSIDTCCSKSMIDLLLEIERTTVLRPVITRRFYCGPQVWQHHSGFGGIDATSNGGAKDLYWCLLICIETKYNTNHRHVQLLLIDSAQLIAGVHLLLVCLCSQLQCPPYYDGMGGLAYSN